MNNDLGYLPTKRKTGKELFSAKDKDLDFDLLSFWQWAASDLLGNTARGCLAEYIVARALNCGQTDVRNEWREFDLKTKDGFKVEVKSAAYIQSWHQEKHSRISFSIRSACAWDPLTAKTSKESLRHADVYVFALLANKTKQSINPMDFDQWRFLVVPTNRLNAQVPKDQKSISLTRLENFGYQRVEHQELDSKIKEVMQTPS